MPRLEFRSRFGGETSLLQELEDVGYQLPVWLRPLWRVFIVWFSRFVRWQQIKREMASVDRQAAAIADAQAEQDTLQVVITETPPDPESEAQTSLGFGSLEIKAPYRTD